MLDQAKKLAVLARNYAVYKQHAVWAATTKARFPLDPTSNFVITMASYPGRIHLVPAAFESLARQKGTPRSAYLVLSDEDFPRRIIPKSISRLAERGVTIVWNSGNPYATKKLTEVWGRDPDCSVLAFDDDFIYAPNTIANICTAANGRKKTVVGYVGKKLFRKGQTLSMSYRDKSPADAHTNPRQTYLQGGLGTLYQPGSLHEDFLNKDALRSIIPGRGSDIWFWAAACAADSDQICISSLRHSRMFLPIPETRTTKPKDKPGWVVLEERFQKAIDYFGIRDKLLKELPDYEERIS
jgi:hypothetical protein